MRIILCLLLVLIPVPAFAQLLAAQRLAVGPSPSPPSGSSVRVSGLGASGGDGVVFTDAEGDMIKRALTTADIPVLTRGNLPPTIAYTDEAEVITQPWMFSAGITGPLSVSVSVTSPVMYASSYLSTPMVISPSGNQLTVSAGNGTTEWSANTASIRPEKNYGPDIGLPSRKWRSLHVGEMFVETIVAQQRITTMGGRFTVTPSNVLTRDFPFDSTTICVKYNSFLYHEGGVEYGSKLLMEKAGQFEWFRVLNITPVTVDPTFGDYCYSIDRNLDGTGPNNWSAGDGIVDTGKVGSGMIDQFAVRGLTSDTIEGPSIDFLVRTGDFWGNLSHRASVGNLNGRYGFGTDTYGLAAGDPAAANIIVIPTKVALRTGTTEKITLDGASGDVSLAGNLVLTSGGSIISVGNFSLTQTTGLTFVPSTTAGGDAARRIYFGSTGGSIHTYNNILHLIGGSGGSGYHGAGSIGTYMAGSVWMQSSLYVGSTSSSGSEILPNIAGTGSESLGSNTYAWSHLYLDAPASTGGVNIVDGGIAVWNNKLIAKYTDGLDMDMTYDYGIYLCTIRIRNGIMTEFLGCV